MTTILEFLKTFYITLSVIPYVVFAAVWAVCYLLWKNKKRSTQLAMDVTTFFLITSVAGLANSTMNFKFSWWFIILVLLIAFGVVGGYQYRLKGESDVAKVFRLIWRLSFVVLAVLYVILLFIELIRHLFST